MQVIPQKQPEYERFIAIIAALRAPDGCPWDREQTHESIAKNMIEEAYEAIDAIEEDDIEHLREELGDVLLQVALQSQIAADAGEFTMEDVAHDISEKMVRRHPHVFGLQAAYAAAGIDPGTIETGDDVLPVWDQIKDHERKMKAEARAAKRIAAGLDPDEPAGLLDEVSRMQPALMQASELSKKTVHVGFEWNSTDEVWDKVAEEMGEYREAEAGSDEAELEFGDVLFALVNVARRDHIDPESALRRTCEKFRHRWESMERFARDEGLELSEAGTEQLGAYWERAKRAE